MPRCRAARWSDFPRSATEHLRRRIHEAARAGRPRAGHCAWRSRPARSAPPGNDGFLNHLVSKLIKVSLEMKVHRGIPRTVIYVLWASARRWSLQGGGTDRGVVPEATNHTERFRSASNSQPSRG